MENNPVRQYYKCPITGVEMNFIKDDNWGWCIQFPNKDDGILIRNKIEIPWPKLTIEEQSVVDNNYEYLNKILEEEDGI